MGGELYDLNEDPKEWNNVAYQSQNRSVIESHREVLKEMLPDISWKEGPPEGYQVYTDGTIRRD